MKSKRIIVFFLILFILILIICDYANIITKMGLSLSLWSGFVTGIFPIVLTIYLWKIEQKERINQIKEESYFQKKLILRSTYIEYFESLLEQINEYSIFLECYLLRYKSFKGKKLNLDNRVKSILRYVKVHSRYEVWRINYRLYAFKCIDIDIFNYKYNDKIINLRTFMPYIDISNKLTAIYTEKDTIFGLDGFEYANISEMEQEELAKSIVKNIDEAKELYDLLIYLKNDIEKRIAFD